MSWINDPVNSPKHYTDSHPGMECIDLTADTTFCLGNCCKYLWRYHSKGRPLEDLEKARWYLCRVIDHDEKIAWTRQRSRHPRRRSAHMGETPARLPLFGPRLPRPPHRTRKEPTMSTRLYYDQYGIPTDISELEAGE